MNERTSTQHNKSLPAVEEEPVHLQLVGLDGNAFALMGAFARQARVEGWPQASIDAVLEEAKSDDYDHLLLTLLKHCESQL